MSTAELELRRSLGDVLDDELNRIPDHWNTTSHSNRSLEDLLILPAQEHHQDYQLSSPIFKHFTTNNNNNNSSNMLSNNITFAAANHHSILPSSMINNTPMIDDTHSGYTAVAEGISTANIFSKYADPSLTTTHVNTNQEQSQQRDSHHRLQAPQQQGHQNVLQHQHKRAQRATDTSQLTHTTKTQQKQYLSNQTQNLTQKRPQQVQQHSKQQTLLNTQSKQQQSLPQSPVAAQNGNLQICSTRLPSQSPQAQQLLQQCTNSARFSSNAVTPTQPTISLNNVMCTNNPFIPRFASTCASSVTTNPLSTVAGATIACNQISLSKYNLIDDHQTRIADQQELELMDNDDYIRDYYLEENGHKMNYLWPLQDNFNNSQSHFHDPMQQLFDQDFDDDLSDEDDDSNSFELLGDDYEDLRNQDDESQFFGCRKAGLNTSVISTARPPLNNDSCVGNGMAIDGLGTCENIDNGNGVDDVEGDEDENEDDDEEDDDSSSVFDDDDLFESKGARKPSMVLSSKKLSKASKSFKNMALTPSSPSSSNDTVIPSASSTGTAVNSDTSAVLISVPIQNKKGIKASARSENVDASPPATTASSSTAKSKKRVATNRRKSSGTGMIPHLAKKSSTPITSNVGVSVPSHSLPGVVASTATSHIPASNVAAAKDSISNASPVSASQQNQVTHHHHSYSNDPNEEHTCLLINPITKLPCLKKFSRPYDLIRHQKTIHASKKKIFRCLICIQEHGTEGYQRTFSRGDALSRHVKVKHELVGEEAQKVIQFAKENVEYVEA